MKLKTSHKAGIVLGFAILIAVISRSGKMTYADQIEYTVPPQFPLDSIYVELFICSKDGQKIKTLVKERQAKGKHVVTWDGMDENGKRMPEGVYRAFLWIANPFHIQLSALKPSSNDTIPVTPPIEDTLEKDIVLR